MKYLLVLALVFLAATPSLAQQAVATGSKPIILPQYVPPDPNAKFPCRNAPFFLTLAGQKYKIMRLPSLQYVPVGSDLPVTSREKTHAARDCALTDGGSVTSFTTGFIKTNDVSIELSAPPADVNDAPVSTYDLNKESISVATSDKLFRQLPYGVAKATMDNVEFYLLPKKNAPTKDGNPVLVYCSTRKIEAKTENGDKCSAEQKTKNGRPCLIDETQRPNYCKAAYHMPDGLFLDYYFLRGSFKEDMYASVDKMVRDRIEKMRTLAKNGAPSPSAAQSPQTSPTPN